MSTPIIGVNSIMRNIIVGLSIILVLLLVFFFLLSKNNSTQHVQNQNTENGSGYLSTGSSTGNTARKVFPTLGVQEKQKEVAVVNAKFLSIDQAKRFQAARNKLPISTKDFDIAYSPILDQYFISLKTQNAPTLINQFLSTNSLMDIKNSFPQLFVTTRVPIDKAIQTAEHIFISNVQYGRYWQATKDSEQHKDTTVQDSLGLLDVLINNPYMTDKLDETDQGDTTLQVPVYKPGEINSIDAIIAEEKVKVGVPGEAIDTIVENGCKHMFTFPSDKIREYSTPGNGLPQDDSCYSTNLDSTCCLGPAQLKQQSWMIYATSIKELGGYSHEPNVENIRDSIYAAAKKMKVDGGGASPNNWTKNQFQSALQKYYSLCDDPSSSTLCDQAWQNYLDNKL